jgi:membrane associated rhomboid family serine protease
MSDSRLLIRPNRYGTHADVVSSDSMAPHAVGSGSGVSLIAPGESLFGIDYEEWNRWVGRTVDLLELQAVAAARRARDRRVVASWASVPGDDWHTDPPLPEGPSPPGGYGFSTGRRAVPCTRAQLIRQCVEVPETPGVWTPDLDGVVRPESVPFLVDALRRRRVAAAESQTTVAGVMLASLSGIAWLAGAGARSGWVVLCALAAAWLTVALYQSERARADAAAAYPAAREQHRHSIWLERHPALLTWVLVAILAVVMIAQLQAIQDPIQAAGVVKPLVREGEYWRLLTGAMLHGGMLHLGLNVLAIWSLGPLVEAHAGRPILPAVFVASAFIGSLTSVWLVPDAPSVGASGGILGLVGYLFVLGYRRRRALPQGFVGRIGLGILATGVFGIVGYALVDNAMHLGGLLAGMLLAVVLPLQIDDGSLRSRSILETLGDLAIGALVITAAGVIRILI